MKVILELEIENCEDCPNFEYIGDSWGEPCYNCKKTGYDVGEGEGIPNHCPLIESTMKRLRELHKRT